MIYTIELTPRLHPKLEKKDLSLKKMIARITNENRHSEADWGDAVGNEVW